MDIPREDPYLSPRSSHFYSLDKHRSKGMSAQAYKNVLIQIIEELLDMERHDNFLPFWVVSVMSGTKNGAPVPIAIRGHAHGLNHHGAETHLVLVGEQDEDPLTTLVYNVEAQRHEPAYFEDVKSLVHTLVGNNPTSLHPKMDPTVPKRFAEFSDGLAALSPNCAFGVSFESGKDVVYAIFELEDI